MYFLASQNTGINTAKPSLPGKQPACKKKTVPKSDENRVKKVKKSSSSSFSEQHVTKISNETVLKSKRNVIVALEREWHAPGSYIFDNDELSVSDTELSDLVSFTQSHWYPTPVSTSPPVILLHSSCDKKKNPTSSADSSNQSIQPPVLDTATATEVLTREQRLLLKKDNLRRRTRQVWRAQSLRCTMQARKRLRMVQHLLNGLKANKEEL